MAFRVAELCAGYSGLFLAMRRAGWPVELAWYAETDPDASRVLSAHHPGVPNAGDITTVRFAAQGSVEIVAAGWPCQGASVAGKRLGSADDRHLWPDVARALRLLRPRLFVGENVPGLLTIERGQLFGAVLADLDRLGYTTRWTTVGACRVGLCHHRHRVFLLAALDGAVPQPDRWPVARRQGDGWSTAADTLFGSGQVPAWPAAGLAQGGRVWAEPAWPCGAEGIVLPTPVASAYGSNQSPTPGAAVRPSLEGVVQMLPTPGARLGDGRGEPTVELATARLDSGRRNLDDAVALLPTPTAVHHARNATARRRAPKDTTHTDGWTLHDVAYADRWRQYGAAVRRHELVTGTSAPEPTEPGAKGQPRLAPPFPEWMQTLPPGWICEHVGRGAALRIIGNGVATNQGAYGLSLLATALPILDLAEAAS